MRLPENQNRLTRVLFFFRYRITTRILPRRTKVVQYSRCWLWHNNRVCSSSPRYRVCGSAQHTEEKHVNQCAGPASHSCPPGCIHCHGPHPAHDSACELRPKSSSFWKTKFQITAICRIYTEALFRRQAEMGFIKPSNVNVIVQTTENDKQNTITESSTLSIALSKTPGRLFSETSENRLLNQYQTQEMYLRQKKYDLTTTLKLFPQLRVRATTRCNFHEGYNSFKEKT